MTPVADMLRKMVSSFLWKVRTPTSSTRVPEERPLSSSMPPSLATLISKVLLMPDLAGMTTLTPKARNALPSLLVRIWAERVMVPHTVTLHLIIILRIDCFTCYFEQELSTLQGILLVLLSLQSLLVVLRHLLRDDDAIDDGGNGALLLSIREVRVSQSLLDSGQLGIT